jgi:hypothetical protein
MQPTFTPAVYFNTNAPIPLPTDEIQRLDDNIQSAYNRIEFLVKKAELNDERLHKLEATLEAVFRSLKAFDKKPDLLNLYTG